MIKATCRLLICLVCISCFHDVVAQQQTLPGNATDRMRYDVTLLASDSLQGREAGTYGEQMAADYISKSMAAIGLLPKGEPAASFYSEFRMSFPVIFKDAKLQVDDIEFKYIEEFGATDLSSPGEVSAPLIYFGKGINAVGRKSIGNQAIDVAGKIVLLDIATSLEDNENDRIINEILGKVKEVVDKGAAGVILHNSSRKPTENFLFGSPFTESLNVPVIYIARLPFNKIRKVKTATCKLKVEIDRTVTKPVNVIGWLDNKAQKTVIVGAHYDHLGIKKGKTDPEGHPVINNGADDNASGTAAMLELARWAAANKSLKYNYLFVAFSAEEKGLFGSKAFCSRPWVNNENIAYMLNLDMVGRLGCQGDTISVLGVASTPAWEPVLDSLTHPDFCIKKINGAPPFSDHSPFLKKGIPVIYFTTGIHPDYHTPRDDAGLINFEGMSELESYMQKFILAAEALPGIPFHKINTLQQTKAYIQTF
jgi:aminopeptidase YwaD